MNTLDLQNTLPWTIETSKTGHVHIKDKDNRWVAKMHNRSAKDYDPFTTASTIIEAVSRQDDAKEVGALFIDYFSEVANESDDPQKILMRDLIYAFSKFANKN